MKVSRDQLLAAASASGIDTAEAERLWTALDAGRTAPGAPGNGAVVAYYFGGFIVIGAMTLFMTFGWELFGIGFLTITALIYMLAFGYAGLWMWNRGAITRIPGGILTTVAVFTAPLFVFGLEQWTHFWASGPPGAYSAYYQIVHGSWVPMELATIVLGLVALRFVRFPLITLPIAFSLWFLSMDSATFFYHKTEWGALATIQIQTVSLIFGIVMLAIALAVDRRTKEDFAFWLYLYGGLTFFAGLTMLWNGTIQWHMAIYALISLVVFAFSVAIVRRALTVFSILSLAWYIGYLAWDIFPNALIFPFVLTFIGLVIIALGLLFAKNEAKVRAAVRRAVPASILGLLPAPRD
jgi:hypothetical protein